MAVQTLFVYPNADWAPREPYTTDMSTATLVGSGAVYNDFDDATRVDHVYSGATVTAGVFVRQTGSFGTDPDSTLLGATVLDIRGFVRASYDGDGPVVCRLWWENGDGYGATPEMPYFSYTCEATLTSPEPAWYDMSTVELLAADGTSAFTGFDALQMLPGELARSSFVSPPSRPVPFIFRTSPRIPVPAAGTLRVHELELQIDYEVPEPSGGGYGWGVLL